MALPYPQDWMRGPVQLQQVPGPSSMAARTSLGSMGGIGGGNGGGPGVPGTAGLPAPGYGSAQPPPPPAPEPAAHDLTMGMPPEQPAMPPDMADKGGGNVPPPQDVLTPPPSAPMGMSGGGDRGGVGWAQLAGPDGLNPRLGTRLQRDSMQALASMPGGAY